jgi:hypothetical protein
MDATREFRVLARDRDNGFMEARVSQNYSYYVLGVLTSSGIYKSYGHGLGHGAAIGLTCMKMCTTCLEA